MLFYELSVRTNIVVVLHWLDGQNTRCTRSRASNPLNLTLMYSRSSISVSDLFNINYYYVHRTPATTCLGCAPMHVVSMQMRKDERVRMGGDKKETWSIKIFSFDASISSFVHREKVDKICTRRRRGQPTTFDVWSFMSGLPCHGHRSLFFLLHLRTYTAICDIFAQLTYVHRYLDSKLCCGCWN